jgi:enoyl-CoA hydratase/carnithine racemase
VGRRGHTGFKEKKMGTEAWDKYEAIKVARHGAIVTVRFNRPETANALNWKIDTEFYEVLKTFGADDSVKCVILTAEGKHFSSGHDILDAVCDA